MMDEPDHEKNAIGQMLSEATGREMQLRVMLGKMQVEMSRLRDENERLKATAEPASAHE